MQPLSSGGSVFVKIVLGVTVSTLVLAVDAQARFTSPAQIQDLVPDARSQGMGRAFTAVADGGL